MVNHLLDEILDTISDEETFCGGKIDSGQVNELTNNKDTFLKIMHLNIRSVNKNLDNLLTFIESYELQNFDIIALSETFQLLSTNNCNIPGYQLFYNEAKYNKNDGVILLVKNNIQVNFSCTQLPNSEVTVGRLIFERNDILFGMTAIYKPPPIPQRIFIDDLHSFLESSANCTIEILLGDININILNNNDNNVANYLSILSSLGFQYYIKSITRSLTNSCLDHIFVKQKIKSNNLFIKSCILEEDITDHSPVMLFIGQKEKNNKVNQMETVIKTKLNVLKFKQKLQEASWSVVMDENDPELATKFFLSIYNQLLTDSTEKYTIKVKTYRKIKSWITDGIIRSIKIRDKMKKRLLNNHNFQLEEEYKKYRNLLNKIINKQKNDYYRHQVENNKNNIKKLYEIINDATYETNKKNKKNINIKNDLDENFTDSLTMANFCNEYFSNIGIRMARAIPDTLGECEEDPSTIDNSIFLKPVNKSELIKHIASLKNNSSPGHDSIRGETIKQTHLEILDPLLHVFNLILEKGVVPTDFKISIITPIHKSGSLTAISNYRPISLISNFAKLFERCLKDRLTTFFKNNNILSPNQFGFVEGYSTSDAMHKLTSEIIKNLNLNKKCLAVFLDLARAFDTVPHHKLLQVLKKYGLRGIALELLESYLTERYQMLRLNDIISEKQKIKIGVPQGTVLGPLLFICYINGLLKLLNINGQIISYADDTVIVFAGDTWEIVKKLAINGLIKVTNWLQNYKLTLNLNKTNYVAFSLTRKNRPHFNNITIKNHSIQEVTHIKYLGIIIDQFLKWQPHMDYVSAKLRKLIHKFYLLREFLNKKTLITIYKAFVESLIRYGILVWGGLYKNCLYKLKIIQKYMLKIMLKKNKSYPSNLLFSEDICNIRSLYMLEICTYIHRNNALQRFVDHSYQTRINTKNSIQIPISNNNINLKYINYIGPKVYNKLPLNVKNINQIKFKNLCKKFIYENYLELRKLF